VKRETGHTHEHSTRTTPQTTTRRTTQPSVRKTNRPHTQTHDTNNTTQHATRTAPQTGSPKNDPSHLTTIGGGALAFTQYCYYQYCMSSGKTGGAGKIEVDALGVITISHGCFERCDSNKKTPPQIALTYSNLSS